MLIDIVLCMLLSAFLSKWLARLFKLPAKLETAISYVLATVVITIGSAIAFSALVLTYIALDQANVRLWGGSDEMLLKALAMGFLSALWGAYLGFKWAKEAGNTSVTSSIKHKISSLPKSDRQWLFGGVVWAVGVLLYTIGFDPFDRGGWWSMNSDNHLTLLFAMFVPPVFAWLANKAYIKFVQ